MCSAEAGSPPTRSAGGPRLRDAIVAACLALTSLGNVACQPRDPTPTLVAARFADENHDGVPQVGESIVLTFSAPVGLAGDGSTIGVHLAPAERAQLGSYRVEPGESETQLRVILGLGTAEFTAVGVHGADDGATGLLLDFDRIAIVDESGARLRGQSPVVDLALSVPTPGLLLRADWVDRDRNHAVTEGDDLELTFDRPVRIADSVKLAGAVAPPSLLRLPIRSDRLDDGTRPTRLRAADEEAAVWLTLGSHPRLTILGDFDHRLINQPDAPSGLAVQGTRIRANFAIEDRFGVGVASHEFVDLGTAEPCEPFIRSGTIGPRPRQIELHTVTGLPDGQLILIGGLVEDERGLNPSDELWVHDGDGSWLGPVSLKQARYGHTANYFYGADGVAQTADDFILVAGGFDGHKALRDLEVVLPYAPGGVLVLPVYDGDYVQHLTPRFFHTAHGYLDRLVLVGGQISQELNARVEEVVIRVSWSTEQEEPQVSAKAQKLGTLQYAREFHDSCLLVSQGEYFVFLYGGWGTSNLRGLDQVELPPQLVNPTDSILGQPELFSLHEQTSTILARRASSGDPPTPRRGHRLVNLTPQAEAPEFLLVGGTQVSPRGGAAAARECRGAHRLRVFLDEAPPTVEWQAAGSLAAERHSITAVLLPDGNVLVAGGAEDGAPSNRAELFDAAHSDFAPICASLLAPREGAQVAPTLDEGWLLIGGRGARDPVVERFDLSQ
ncbi:MAG: hypothetical protein AB7O52_12330 [Planctomycetota bacterium]